MYTDPLSNMNRCSKNYLLRIHSKWRNVCATPATPPRLNRLG
jgi:hypothetical protein